MGLAPQGGGGYYLPNEVVNFHPVIVRGNTVGYVGLLSPRHFLHPMQVQFPRASKSWLWEWEQWAWC